MLTIAILTRAFAVRLQELHPFELNPNAVQQGQLHVDFFLNRVELEQTLDDFICKVIEPAAASLADALETRGARYSLPLELPTGKDCYRVQYAGCHLRGIIEHNQLLHTADGPVFVEAARFDILWSK